MRRYEDTDVIAIGTLISYGYTLLRIEADTGVPHSTAHKLVMDRLQSLDCDLYNKCLSAFSVNKRCNLNIINERKKHDRTTTSTKSD